MRMTEKMKKWISMALCLCLLVQYTPAMVFATAEDNLCAHHPAHTEECHYEEGAHECHFQCADCAAEETQLPEEATAPSEEATEPSEEVTEPSEETESEAVCTCESDDPEWHAPFCALYTAPENPECWCVEPCAENAANEWCDVCYFDAAACTATGEETAVEYASTPHLHCQYRHYPEGQRQQRQERPQRPHHH